MVKTVPKSLKRKRKEEKEILKKKKKKFFLCKILYFSGWGFDMLSFKAQNKGVYPFSTDSKGQARKRGS